MGPGGEVFVADTGNNRVLQFAPSPATGAAAVQVYGQSNFSASASPGAVTPQTLSAPRGVFVDPTYNLYVADAGANRVVVYSDIQSNPANGRPAQVVFGQALFTTGGSGAGNAGLNGPVDVTVIAPARSIRSTSPIRATAASWRFRPSRFRRRRARRPPPG